MNLLLWRRPRPPERTHLALDFLNGLRHDALVYPWVVGIRRGNCLADAATLDPGSKQARDWLAAHSGKPLYCMTGEVIGAPRGVVIEECVKATRIIAIRIPRIRLDGVLRFRARPAIIIETKEGYAVGWRLHNPVEAYVARLYTKTVADALGGEPLPFMLPLPGTAGIVCRQYLKGTRYWTLPSEFIRRAPQQEPPLAVEDRPFQPVAQAVMLGYRRGGGEVFWAPFEAEHRLLNFGVLVTGDPGSGKTQTLNVLIDGVAGMGLPVCIFDFKNDYSGAEFVRDIGLRVHDVRRHGIPFNPLLPSCGEDGQAQPIEHIFTIAGLLKRVFNLGDRQAAVLRDAMKVSFERCGVNPQDWVDVATIRVPSFDDVVAVLEEQRETKNSQAAGILDRLAALVELRLFPKSDDVAVPFETMMDERIVLSLFTLPTDEIKAALAELVIIRLHGVLVRRHHPRKLTRLLVLDEAWRVAHSTHLENLAREGRAFGAGIAIGTQYPGDLPADLCGALDTKIYLKNQQADHKRAVVQALCGSASGPEAANLHSLMERLTQFEGLIQNQQYLPFAPFKLRPYFERAGYRPPRPVPQAAPRPAPRTSAASAAPFAQKVAAAVILLPPPVTPAASTIQAGPEDSEEESRRAAARKWLAAHLADHEWHDSVKVLRAAATAGHARTTLLRARADLGVAAHGQANSQRQDWRLPEQGEA